MIGLDCDFIVYIILGYIPIPFMPWRTPPLLPTQNGDDEDEDEDKDDSEKKKNVYVQTDPTL